MAEEAKWYLLHTFSGYENKVCATIMQTVESRNLQSQILELKVPSVIEEAAVYVYVDENGKRVPEDTEGAIRKEIKRPVERKLFPSYVFIKMVMNDETWYLVRYTRGVTGFVGQDQKLLGPQSLPVPLTEEEVYDRGLEVPQITVPYAVGDTVCIPSPTPNGTDYIGKVESIDLERKLVRVIVTMFGRDSVIEAEIDQVEPLN